jgi:biopolymer transport protein ExbB
MKTKNMASTARKWLTFSLLGAMHWVVQASEAASAVAAASAAVATTAVEENPYGLSALWGQGDFVAKSTLLILVLMSMGSWYVIFTKFAEQAKLNKQAAAAKKTFWTASTVELGKETLAGGSAFRYIAEKGLEGASKHTGLLGAVDFNEWVTIRAIASPYQSVTAAC